MRLAPRSLVAAMLLVGALVGVVTACGDDDSTPDTTAAVAGDLAVYASASLAAPLGEIADAFAAQHPGAAVTFTFDTSSALLRQVREGATADVVATADRATMDALAADGLNGSPPVVFATDTVQIVVPAGNPDGITRVADLADPGRAVVLCAPDVPCGSDASKALATAGVSVTPASLAPDGAAVVAKVAAGEADAGIAYLTDVAAAGDQVSGVEIPGEITPLAQSVIATIAASDDQQLGQAFIDFLLGVQAQVILGTYGYGVP